KGNTVAISTNRIRILEEAFKGDAQRDPQLQETPEGGFFVVRVDGVTPPAQRPLAAVAADVRKTLENERRAAALKERALALAERGNKGETIESLGKSIGLTPQQKADLRRGMTDDVFSAEAIEAIFKTARGHMITAPVGKGLGMVIAQLTD